MKDQFFLTVAFRPPVYILTLCANANNPKKFISFSRPIKMDAEEEIGHFCCIILDQLLTLLTLFYFNLLAHTVDLGKRQSCGSSVISILFSKDVNMFTQIMGSCEKNMINTFCISFSPQNYFRIILNKNNYPASQEIPNYL